MEPLSQEGVTQLVASLSAQRNGPPLFSKWLRERTGGNPFFMLETLKALFETNVMSEDGGTWQSHLDAITQDYSELEVPPAVSEVVQRRLRSLSQATQRVLSVAAVIRNGFTAELLGKLTGLSLGAVVEVLDEAERGGLIEQNRFSHDLVRESLYSDLSLTRRSFLHAQVAGLLSSRADPVVVADHWLAASEDQKAVSAWLRAARQLTRRGLETEARPLAERALAYAAEGELKNQVRAQLASIYADFNHNDLASPLIKAVLNSSADPSTRALALDAATMLALDQGDLDGAASLIQEALELIDESDEHWDSVQNSYSSVLFQQGRFEEKLELTKAALARLEKKPPSRYYLTHLMSLGTLYTEQNQFEQAASVYYQVIHKAEVWQDVYILPTAVGNLLDILTKLGRSAEGTPLGEKVLALDLPHSDGLRYNLALAYVALERYAEARALFVHLTEHGAGHSFGTAAWCRLARLHHKLENPAARNEALEQALKQLEVNVFPTAAAIVCSTILDLGSLAQKKRLRPTLASLDKEHLPKMVREQLEQSLTAQPQNRKGR